MRRTTLVLLALALLGGCVERAPELSPADRERLREHISSEAPDPEHDLNVQFENGVRLLGYDVEPDAARRGQPVTITWYWHATEDLDEGWQIFTHVADASGENRLNQDRVGVVRELYQPGRWEAGQYIEDVQRVTIPADWPAGEAGRQAVFYLGLWNGPHRLAIRRGPDDGDNRVRALALDVEGSPSAAAGGEGDEGPRAAVAPPPTLRAPRASGEVSLDGRLTEGVWNQAGRTQPFVNTLSGARAPFSASARMAWDDDNLYVAFEVSDDLVKNTHDERDAHLWEQDTVEVMVDPGGDGRNYFEMQVSPTGQIFDTRYDNRRQPGPIGHADWDSGLRAGVHVEGSANDDETDQGYTVEIAIPWSAFEHGEPAAGRPEPNARWGMNLYVMDNQRPQGQPGRSAGWSPTREGDFHVPNRFGRVIFAAPEPTAALDEQGGSTPEVAPQPTQVQIRPEAAAALREHLARRQIRGAEGIRLPPPRAQ